MLGIFQTKNNYYIMRFFQPHMIIDVIVSMGQVLKLIQVHLICKKNNKLVHTDRDVFHMFYVK